MTFFLRRRWMRAASCAVLSVSAWLAGASETWAIMMVWQVAAARASRSSRVSLWSLGVGVGVQGGRLGCREGAGHSPDTGPFSPPHLALGSEALAGGAG